MATSTLVQYLEASGVSVSGASVAFGTTPSDRLQKETFLTESAITKGQLVALDVTKMATDTTGGSTALTVITADYNSATVQKIVVGVAAASVTGTATSPQPVEVIVRGPALAVPAVGAIAQGDPVVLDPAGAAGSCAAQGAYNSASANLVSEAVGFAMTAAAAGVVNVYVLGKGI
jgi:hypothetical protein